MCRIRRVARVAAGMPNSPRRVARVAAGNIAATKGGDERCRDDNNESSRLEARRAIDAPAQGRYRYRLVDQLEPATRRGRGGKFTEDHAQSIRLLELRPRRNRHGNGRYLSAMGCVAGSSHGQIRRMQRQPIGQARRFMRTGQPVAATGMRRLRTHRTKNRQQHRSRRPGNTRDVPQQRHIAQYANRRQQVHLPPSGQLKNFYYGLRTTDYGQLTGDRLCVTAPMFNSRPRPAGCQSLSNHLGPLRPRT
jgi:hypothetical protein